MYHSIRSVDFHLRNNTEVVLSREEWANIRKELLGDSKNSQAAPVQQTKVTTCPNCKSNFTTGDGVKRWCRDCGESWDDGKQ